MTKDYNYVAAVEKAISDKYGKEAVQDFKSTWDETREKDYMAQLSECQKSKDKNNYHNREDAGGFLISSRARNKDGDRECPVCRVYSFSMQDDLYMSRFECCFTCFVQHVEDREDRWSSGWRPNPSKLGEKG